MNFAVKIFEGFAPMPNHRARKCRQSFCRNFDRPRNEKLMVRQRHWGTSNARSGTSNSESVSPGRDAWICGGKSVSRQAKNEKFSKGRSTRVFRIRERGKGK